MGLNLSGPAALRGLKPTSSLSMPSAAILISGILWWGLEWWHQRHADLAMTSGQEIVNLVYCKF